MRRFTVLVVAVAVGLATAASPYAASAPDGLEKVAADTAFLDRARAHDAPVADYAVPGAGDARVATGLAGFAGTLMVFGLGYGVALVARRRTVAA